MRNRIGAVWGFARTTAIGGLLFLLPLIVIGALLGYAYQLVLVVYDPLKEMIPVSSPTGLLLLFSLSILIVIALCFVCGLLARRAIARRFTQTVEKQLMTVFPKYAIYKDLLAGNVGGEENMPSLLPISVRMQDHDRLGFEADRLADGRVVAYLPGAPDSWIGGVVLVAAEQVERLEIPFADFLTIFERLGRDCNALMIVPPELTDGSSSGAATDHQIAARQPANP